MLDLNFVRENLPLVEEKLRQRGMDPSAVLRDFREVDTLRRRSLEAVQRKQHLRKVESQRVAEFKKRQKQGTATAADLKEMESLIAQSKVDGDLISQLEADASAKDLKLRDILAGIPNLPHASVPVGDSAEQNLEVRRWGTAPKFDFTPKAHWDLGAELGILDLERAVKLTGARFAVYWDLGAKLERALANFMLDLHTRQHGYTEVLPPYLVNSDSMYGTGQLPKFAEDSFKVPTRQSLHRAVKGDLVYREGLTGDFKIIAVDDAARTADIELVSPVPDAPAVIWPNQPWDKLRSQRDFWLIPTAEVPVTNLYRDEVLEQARLPISLAAYTACFRSEAGSYGKDVRGIIRQHQFQKVELVKFTRPEQSYEEHEKLTRDAEEVLQKLGLHYRVVALCTGDMGAASAKTYDIEVWLPGQQLFREISSCSNFEAYQARRANIRYRPEGKNKTEFVHTLNGSGLAVGRTWVAIVENYQQADGSVVIPEALRPYIGAERITPKKF
jgi:seryl-tRNA synthetase